MGQPLKSRPDVVTDVMMCANACKCWIYAGYRWIIIIHSTFMYCLGPTQETPVLSHRGSCRAFLYIIYQLPCVPFVKEQPS